MAKRKATSSAKAAKESLTSEQMRVKHTEMLNASFFRWIQDQHANHRSELWRNGLEEYLQYGRSIQDRFPVSLDTENLSTGGTTDVAPQPNFKQSRLGVMHSQQGEQVPSIAPGLISFGGPQSNSNADSSSHKPATFSFGGPTPAGSSDASAAQRDSMQPLALPPFVVPAFSGGAPSSPGIFSVSHSGSQPSDSNPAASSSLPFGSPSALAPLAAEASTPPSSAATASLPQASIDTPTTASSLFGNPHASTSHPQPTAAPASGAPISAPLPMAFGNSLFPGPFNASTSHQGSAAPQTRALPAVSGSIQVPPVVSTQAATEPKFSFGAAPSTTTTNAPLFGFVASQPAGNTSSSTPESVPFSTGFRGAQPVFGFGAGATPPAFGSAATLPAFGSGVTPPFAFGSSQPAASTSAFGASTSAQASPAQFSWAALPSAGFGSAAGAAGDAATSSSGPSPTAPFSFSWNPPTQSNAAPANGAASFAGFSFSTAGSTGFGAPGGQNGFGLPNAPAAVDDAADEDQPEPEAPTEYAKDEGVITSQEVSWRFMQSDKSWTKLAKGRVLARKSDKGKVYLQFVTSSGQVVATANIKGNLTPHQAKPSNLVGTLIVSARHVNKEASDTYDEPTPKTTMLTCKSETLAQALVQILKDSCTES